MITLAYLWLPSMILPIYAGLERLPDSLLEASGDLGGRPWTHDPAGGPADGVPGDRRRLDLHVLADPGRLHRGQDRRRHEADARQRRSTTTSASANNLPFAAAVATIPVVVMLVYLAVVRRTGALDNL